MEMNIEAFLKVAHEFQLGALVTESPNPLTENLSQLCRFETKKALSSLQQVDIHAIEKLMGRQHSLMTLHRSISDTLSEGGRIFFCGCGATGRLSLSIETLWRQMHPGSEKVLSFMAGGDVALIHSIEKFEDFPSYGERQLREAGFKEGDLLVATTEGGETPFVIGATEEAAEISQRKPFFLYCNPDEVLSSVAQRSKAVINNPKIEKINLTVGPMALSGSTRMQATTVLMLGAAACLFAARKPFESALQEIADFHQILQTIDYAKLEPLTVEEAQAYKDKCYVLVTCPANLGITILTDTTERAPTFSLYPFENQQDKEKNPTWAHLQIADTSTNEEAWKQLLGRAPRGFYWPEVTEQTRIERLWGFELSDSIKNLRESYLGRPQRGFVIENTNEKLIFTFAGFHVEFTETQGRSILLQHLALKTLINAHSTALMGRLGRIEGNLMTFVRPSNYKLIDRCVRYASYILNKKGINKPYAELARQVFELRETLPRDQALVMALVNMNS
jgi:N-acetylmuramic acid 6-phosphate etherase